MSHIENRESTGLVKEYYSIYAKYSLESRSIPSIIDGFKAGQRRLIYCSSKLPNGKLIKSAKIIGDTLPYHPHSQDSLYGTLVGLTTPTNNFHQFDGNGNWGGPGFGAAAMRYTEALLNECSRFCYTQFLDYADYVIGESDLSEPKALPALIPYSLVKGSEGIAVGLSTNIMPLNVMELIDYFIATIQGKRKKTIPTPDVGNVIIDMSDDEIDEAVFHHQGTIHVQSIVTLENNKIVIDDLFSGKGRGAVSIEGICRKLSDLIDSGKVDFRDESSERTRYVFEVIDDSIDILSLKDRITKLTSSSRSFNRIVEENGCAVYTDLDYQVQATLEYLGHVIQVKFERELEKLTFNEQVLLAIEAIKESGLLKELPKLDIQELKQRLSEISDFSDEVISTAISKPITYLTKSHQKELEDIRDRIKENRETDLTKYIISLYREFKKILKPMYDSYPHSIRKSRVLSNPHVKMIDSTHLLVSDDKNGLDFDGLVYAVTSDGYIYPYPIDTSSRKEIQLDEEIVGISPKQGDSLIVAITNKKGVSIWEPERIGKGKKAINLGDGEEVVYVTNSVVGNSQDYEFAYNGKTYQADPFIRVKVSKPVYGLKNYEIVS